MLTRHYFADYDVLWGDRVRTWGQATLTYTVDDDAAFDPAELMTRLIDRAAQSHDVSRADVRIRSVHRL